MTLPNWTHPDVPIGDISKAHVVSLHGTKRIIDQLVVAEFNFKKKDSLSLGKAHDMFDIENAAKITGSRFAFFKNEAVCLELALVRWSINEVKNKGFNPVIVPEICNHNIVNACGFQSRDDSCNLINYS